ncbi:MAG TPA: MBL fold metallo-hydrolase, partial [bacterium]|nr:MBL fold metallo-hydrolase [bacterium]
ATCRPVVTHPCHCTDLSAKIFLSQHVPVEEVRSGLVLEFD